MKAKKLPSGSWRCQVFWYKDENGKNHYKSFTCQDPSPKGKRNCEAEASAWAMNKPVMGSKKKSAYQITFADALEKYITDRENTRSTSTIRKYRGLQRNHFQEINSILLSEIDEDDVQRMINRMIKQKYSAKTIHEVACMVSTIQKKNKIAPFTDLVKPKKKRKQKKIAPTDQQLVDLLVQTKDTPMYLPILVSAFCGLRRGEVAALEVDDFNISKKAVHIHRNMVDVDGGGWIIKEPKTEEGDRYIGVPQCVIDSLPASGSVTDLNPGMITNRFRRIAKKCGLPEGITFHSLRHYTTSVKLMLGENDLVVRKEMGWSEKDFQEMKEIYGHTVEGHEYSTKSCDYFDCITRNIT